MDVEVNKDVQFPLVLLGGEVLVFDASLLKYMSMFENLYKDGFLSYHEHQDFRLSYSLWRLVLSFLAEYDKSGGESQPTKNSWARVIASLDLPRLYDMVRIMNYYGVEVVMRAVLSIVMPRLMSMPRSVLRDSHPKAVMKSEAEMLSAMRNPFEIINKQYSFRREEIKAVCVAYIQTYDIIQIIDQAFLPRTTSLGGTSNDDDSVLLTTSSGILALGENSHGQLGTGIENKQWSYSDETGRLEFDDDDEDEEAHEATLAQWKEWNEERLAKPDWLPVPMPAHLDIISVACGNQHTLFLTTDGLYGAGTTTMGELGVPTATPEATILKYRGGGSFFKELYFSPIRLGVTNVLLVACGWSHSMIYTTEGRLYACGDNLEMQTGLEEHRELKTFTHIPFDKEVSALALDGTVSFVLSKTGRVYRAGSLLQDRATPLRHIPTETRIVAVATSASHALFLDEHGDVYLQNWETCGELPGAEKIIGLPPIVSIFTPARDTSFFVDAAGILYNMDEYSRDIIIIPIPHLVITVISHKHSYYFVTCDGIYKVREEVGVPSHLRNYDKVNPQLSDVPICVGGGRPSAFTFQHCCHQCGEKEQASLGYNKTTQRVFCHTKTCLAKYKEFRVPHLSIS